MYYEDVVNRINSINWEQLNKIEGGNDNNLGGEYLRRMALFYKEHSIEKHPFIFNIAEYLGNEETIGVADCCNMEAQEALKNRSWPRAIVSFYLQLAKYADQKEEAATFLSIYDPLIKLLEKGFDFTYREGGLLIYNACFYSLHDWYERYQNGTCNGISYQVDPNLNAYDRANLTARYPGDFPGYDAAKEYLEHFNDPIEY